ncbi:methyl-accepting chemotaxis protein [Kineosporia succinea]|uniref:Methyl-accepting chemotaxis protein n=1 Tax=Kineosporia succinea TaxID=84632 RepID=A0ABT9NX23_9ACTN|nr:PAS domain-containing methyl-accepting chemotaxis protein [Kineosporia succinea]MDP9824974.1 methyl-accepting chemotaxis protein [Kineosporia succinea]
MGDAEVLEVDEAALAAACVDTVMAGFLVLVVDTGNEEIVSMTWQTAQALEVEPQQLTGRTVEEVLGVALGELPEPQPRPGWSSGDRPLALQTPDAVRAVRLSHRADLGRRCVLVLRDLSETVAAMAEWQAELQALTEGTLQIEFTTDGEVIEADRWALERFGYAEGELTGLPHTQLCSPEEQDSPVLLDLWERVCAGQAVGGVFRRRDRQGEPVWLRGHYVPIPGADGSIVRIVLIAKVIDGEMRRQTDLEGRVSAINRSQAVIEFALDGTVTAVNDNFLEIMDYERSEVVGFPHRIFVDPDYAESADYQNFWARLRDGEFVSGEFHRVGRDDRDVWLQAAYSPVLDPDGRPWKVIKYALDITAEKKRTAEFEGKVAAIDRSQAVIEFGLDGTVLTANDNFLTIVGYDLDEVVGQQHRMFLAEGEDTVAYEEFWRRLRRGEFVTGEFRRRTKAGVDVWLRATYNPVMDPDGRPWKVIKYALDVTDEKIRNADYAGKMTAIDRSQLMVEFDTQGTILGANQNFLDLLGYARHELVGRHHSLLVRPDEAEGPAYQAFWDRLGQGEYHSGEYRRIARDGSEVWIRATYNPVFDPDGNPYKIVKFAVDVTAEKMRNVEMGGQMEAIDRAQAVAEFDLAGKVLAANENFLRTMGYVEDEVLGQPHSMFCSREYVTSDEYRDFWMRLRKGEMIAGRFQRKGKYGRDVYVQASYNPILDVDGKPLRVLEYAYDVSGFVSLQTRLQLKSRAMSEAAQKLAEVTSNVASRCTRSDMMLSQVHDEATSGTMSSPASLNALSGIQRTSNHIGEVSSILADLARQSNAAAFTMSVELGRDQVSRDSLAVVTEEVRRLADRASQAAMEITRLVEDVKLEINHGYEASRRGESSLGRVSSTVGKARENVGTAAELVRSQQVLVADIIRLIDDLEDVSGPGLDLPPAPTPDPEPTDPDPGPADPGTPESAGR